MLIFFFGVKFIKVQNGVQSSVFNLVNPVVIYFRVMMLPVTTYQKVNGCTKQFECQQVFWALSFIALISLYSVVVTPPIINWENIPLIVFMSLLYFTLLPIFYDYLFLTCVDPVDPHIKLQKSKQDNESTKLCSICHTRVGLQTFHCMRCMRCTQRLDHHSHLVNNCISLTHIKNYIRMTLCFNILMLNMAIQSIVIFAFSFSDDELMSYIINRWLIAALGACAFLSFFISIGDIIFSCYVRIYKKMSKFQYIHRQTESNNSEIDSSDKDKSSSASNINREHNPSIMKQIK